MIEQTNLFGIADIINQPKRSVCGCFIPDCNCEKQRAIEAHFLAGKSLTVLDAVKLFKTIDLRKYVSILRKKHNIVGTWVFHPRVKYKVYKIEKDGNNT